MARRRKKSGLGIIFELVGLIIIYCKTSYKNLIILL